MAIEDVLNATKSALGLDRATPAEAAEERRAVLQDLHLTEKAWLIEGSSQGRWFARDGDLVAFTPTAGNGAPLTIGGLTTNFIPAGRFADYLQEMRAAIERGEFDAEIAAAHHGSASVSGLADVDMPPLRHGDPESVLRDRQAEALAREGRNPDGSIIDVVGERR